MSKIDKMIAKLCPDGVEYKRLGDIGSFTRGSGIQKKDFVDEGMPYIHYGQIYTRFGLFTDHALVYIPESQYKKCKKANPGDVIFAITSENIEDVCTPLVWEGKQPIAISGHSCAFSSSEINPRFLAYVATGLPFQNAKARAAKGTKVIEVAPADLARAEIPVPPMEIQQEIVHILDSFAKLEAELEAELEARKAQYAFYRDKLLTFERESLVAKAMRTSSHRRRTYPVKVSSSKLRKWLHTVGHIKRCENAASVNDRHPYLRIRSESTDAIPSRSNRSRSAKRNPEKAFPRLHARCPHDS